MPEAPPADEPLTVEAIHQERSRYRYCTVFVVEGEGYDLHWDVNFAVDVKFTWSWAEEPRRFNWKRGDFVYIPPYVMHKHFNSDPKNPARIIVVHNRILKAMGAAWYEQIETYEGYDPKEDPKDALKRLGLAA